MNKYNTILFKAVTYLGPFPLQNCLLLYVSAKVVVPLRTAWFYEI